MAAVAGLAVFLGVALLNEVAFRAWLDSSYLRWYLENGALISVLFGLVTLAWGDLDKQTYLISAHPAEYAAASLGLLILPISALQAMLEPGRDQWRRVRRLRRASAAFQQLRVLATNPEGTRELRKSASGILYEAPSTAKPEPEDEPTGVPGIDLLFTLFFELVFVLALIAWLLLVVPVQYFVYLVTGAPAREACASPARALYAREGKLLIYQKALKSQPIPEGTIESGFSARPVSFTAAITAATLFVGSRLV